jgi:hypothetical protein
MEKKLAYPTAVLLNELRKNLFGHLADLVQHPSKVVSIKRRSEVSAYLVSFARFAPLIEALATPEQADSTRQSVAWLIVERWLEGAPAHLRGPQLQELATLAEAPLKELLFTNPKRASQQELERIGMDAKLAQRLLKRHKMARAIATAEAEGLYEAVEHKASKAL